MECITKFKAFDGAIFDTEADCRSHEKKLAHKRLIGLTEAEVDAALSGHDQDLANAIELVGSRIARARIADGIRKRRPNGEAAPRQITHQPESRDDPDLGEPDFSEPIPDGQPFDPVTGEYSEAAE